MVKTEVTEIYYQSPEFWLGVAFILVVIFLFKPIKKQVSILINKRINRIKKEFNEIEVLNFEAQEIVAKYKRMHLNIDDEINNKYLEEQIRLSKQKDIAEAQLLTTHRIKDKEVSKKLLEINSKAFKEAKAILIDKIIIRLSGYLNAKYKKNDYNKLILRSIENINKISK